MVQYPLSVPEFKAYHECLHICSTSNNCKGNFSFSCLIHIRISGAKLVALRVSTAPSKDHHHYFQTSGSDWTKRRGNQCLIWIWARQASNTQSFGYSFMISCNNEGGLLGGFQTGVIASEQPASKPNFNIQSLVFLCSHSRNEFVDILHASEASHRH